MTDTIRAMSEIAPPQGAQAPDDVLSEVGLLEPPSLRALQTVIIAVPTAYVDPDQARRAVLPYVRDMRVTATILTVRDTEPGDEARS